MESRVFLPCMEAVGKNQPSLNLKTSFITSNNYTCLEINAHALLILIKYHREHAGEKNLDKKKRS